ncbi:MAG TPA: DUF6584 family protein [Rugosimonospora sp.]|nr:DUF6584 family protein [Rugosimonospora sp.]
MAKQDVLSRVKVDLAHGRTHLARQRLRTLLAIDPDDLDVRDLLADVYRQSGNPVEAGRWAYLSPGLDADEATAFERAHPSPWLRLRLLRYTGDPDELTPAARDRLRALTAEAEKLGPPPDWQGTGEAPGERRGLGLPCLFVAIALLILGTLVAIGIYRLVGVLLGL